MTPITKHPKIVESARWYQEDKTAYLEGVSEADAILQPEIDLMKADILELRDRLTRAKSLLIDEGYKDWCYENLDIDATLTKTAHYEN